MAPRVIGSIDELKSLVGQEVGHSDWITVSQEMINRFAELSGDHQWIHVDLERAKKESPYKTTISHGFLTLSMLTRLQADSVKLNAGQKMGINYGLNRVRFPSPVLAGARIRSTSAIKEIEDFDGGVQVTWLVTVHAEGGQKPVLVAEWLSRVYL